MITITRRHARLLRSVFQRRFLRLPWRFAVPPLVLTVDPQAGLRVRYRHKHVAVECLLPGPPRPRETVILPLDALAVLSETDDSPVTIELERPGVTVVNWTDFLFPRTRSYDVPERATLPNFPIRPKVMHDAPAELLVAFAAAAHQSERVRLDTHVGELTPSDGCGHWFPEDYVLPWPSGVIVSGTEVLSRPALRREPLRIGRSRGHVVLNAGTWTVWLAEHKFLYPEEDDSTA